MTDDLTSLLRDYLSDSEEAFDRVSLMVIEEPERCWEFLIHALSANLSEQELAFLAAGPLENLLSHHGRQFTDRLEVAARQDKTMRFLVAAVWRGGMDIETWSRVEALRRRLGIVPV